MVKVKQKEAPIVAKLTIKDLPGMTKQQRSEFLTWLKNTYIELVKEKDQKVYAKNCRFTLYK